MLRALELERHYSKTQLLEAYLNLAPYGRNIEGVGAASEIYFGKEPAQLTLHEAVTLSLIPQSPARRALRTEGDASAQLAARNRLYASLTKSEVAIDESFSPRAEAKHGMLAPHSTTRNFGARGPIAKFRARSISICSGCIERRVADYVAANQPRGIHNAAAMLVDNRTMEVLAQVGSADFANESIDGQVDGTRARARPGSTLKPFVYALALDQGLIHPLTMLKDAPRSFGALRSGKFRSRICRPDQGHRCARAQPQHSCRHPRVGIARHPTLYGFLKGGRQSAARRKVLRARAPPRWRGSHDGGSR